MLVAVDQALPRERLSSVLAEPHVDQQLAADRYSERGSHTRMQNLLDQPQLGEPPEETSRLFGETPLNSRLNNMVQAEEVPSPNEKQIPQTSLVSKNSILSQKSLKSNKQGSSKNLQSSSHNGSTSHRAKEVVTAPPGEPTPALDPNLIQVTENQPLKESDTVKSLPTHTLSSVNTSSLDYFVDEELNQMNREKSKNIYFYYESDVNFSLSQYIEFFLYHFIYFACLGPFTAVLGCCSGRLRNLFHNMAFNSCNTSGLAQVFYWASSSLTITTFILFHVLDHRWATVNVALVKVSVLGIILRTTSIAGKYATYPKKLIEKIKSLKLSDKEMKAEFMLTGWMSQSFEIRFTEISNAIERNEIDRSVLQMCFMSALCESSVDGLSAVLQERDDPAPLAIKRVYSKKTMRYYNAEYVLDYMIKEFNKSLNDRYHWTFGFFVALFWTGFNVALRAAFGLKVHGNTGYEMAVQSLTFVCATLQVWF